MRVWRCGNHDAVAALARIHLILQGCRLRRQSPSTHHIVLELCPQVCCDKWLVQRESLTQGLHEYHRQVHIRNTSQRHFVHLMSMREAHATIPMQQLNIHWHYYLLYQEKFQKQINQLMKGFGKRTNLKAMKLKVLNLETLAKEIF